MKRNIQFLLIDPQNDFCDLPADWLPAVEGVSQLAAPALPVAGAHGDMLRLAKLIDESAAGISGITVTLDSHHRYDIAHPTFWTMRDGTAVSPFTTIIASQVRAGDFAPRDALALPRALAYLDELEHQGRYRLMVWPVHCEIGSWGHNVHAAVKAAYNRWEDSRLRVVEKVTKGSNPWTEHYSAMQAEVPDAADPATQMNRPLIARLDRADLVVIAGEASSHCVRATTEHLADNLPSGRIDKLVLLADCMSPVSGFETQADAFIETMRQRGAAVTDSISFAATLAANA